MAPTKLCCAYLRVYQPLDALSEADQLAVARLREGDIRRPRGLGLLAPEELRELYEKRVGDATLVCLAHLRLRSLIGLFAFERAIPDAAVPAFFSDDELVRARAELEQLRRSHPGIQPAVVQSVWHIPVRWFVCFDEGERYLEVGPGGPTIRYETALEVARRRVGEALEALSGGVVHPVIVGMIFELKEWLEAFDDRSIIELDYASVATLFDSDELADDHSASDVWSAIRALASGDGAAASLYYRRVSERWARTRRLESLN